MKQKTPFWKQPWFWLVFLAFACALCVVQIDSYQADKHGLNTMWYILSFATGTGAAYFLYRVKKLYD